MIRQNELQSAAVQPTLKQPRRSLCYAQACRDRGTHCVGRVHPEPAGNRDVRVTESPDRPGRQQGVDDAIVIAQVIWSLRNSTFGQVVLAGYEDAVVPSKTPGPQATVLQVSDANGDFGPFVDQVHVSIVELKIQGQLGIALQKGRHVWQHKCVCESRWAGYAQES